MSKTSTTGNRSGLGVSLQGAEPAVDLPGLARCAEDGGADTLWLASHLFQRDPIVQTVMTLSATQRITGALMSLSPYVMHPVQIAMTAASLNEHFPGRICLCIGAGAPGDLAAAGIQRPKPLATLAESLEITKILLSGDVINLQGKQFRVTGRSLETGRQDVPIVLAATGPKMLRLAGRHADGVLLSAATTVEFVRWSLDQVSASAETRKVRHIGLVFASVDNDEGRAYEKLKRLLAFVLRGAHHEPNITMGGANLNRQELYDAVADNNWSRAVAMISDEVVARHSVSGTPGQVQARLEEYRAAGLDEVVVAGIDERSSLAATLAALQPPAGTRMGA